MNDNMAKALKTYIEPLCQKYKNVDIILKFRI